LQIVAANDDRSMGTGRSEVLPATTVLKLTLNSHMAIVDANPAAVKAWGLSLEQLIGTDFASFFTNPERASALHAAAVSKGKAAKHLLELKAGEGAVWHLQCQGVRMEGEPLRVLITAREINTLNGGSKAFVEDQERFRLAFEFSNTGIGMADLDGNIFEANQSLCAILGYSEAELKRLNLRDIWAPDEQAQALVEFNDAATKERFRTVFERRFVNKHGELLCAEVTRGLVQSKASTPMYFTFSLRDVTESKRLQAMLEQQASTDPLTGAMNRNRLDERARFELLRSDRYGDKLSLVIMDLDHFKVVNDTHGHNAGDRVLRGFCEIAQSCLRSIDMLGRWGGEEFVILLPETGPAGARIVAERIRLKLEEFRFEGDIQVTVSMGVAGHREDEELHALLERADSALYEAKQGGRNLVVLDWEDAKKEAVGGNIMPPVLILHWKPSYLCGHPVIDAEHQELFRMANRIIGVMTVGGGETSLLPLVRELIAHVRMHFLHEEEILRAAGYSLSADHGEIHRELEKGADKLADQFEQGQGSETDLLRFIIHDIVAKHMLQEDRKFFPFLLARQV